MAVRRRTRQDRLRDPDSVVAALDLRPGMVVGDLGPGTGTSPSASPARSNRTASSTPSTRARARSMTCAERPTSARSRRSGRCWCVATASRSRSRWTCCSSRPPTTTCRTRRGTSREAKAYLRPGAKVAILESRREGLLARWEGRHASSPRRVLREMEEAGYRLTTTHDVVRGYWFGLFEVAP